jgi:DNA-binding CsgD family transcriptional regulator
VSGEGTLAAVMTPSVGLVEREREVGVLASLSERAAAGEGGAVVVEGPAGIGKSRLLAELRAAGGGRDLTVLLARAGELEREFPFGVVRQLFEGQLADPSTGEEVFSGAAAAARPVFGAVAGNGAGDGVAAPDEDASFAVLHGLFWLTLNLSAERPLLLAVDDLQWCDRASLRFLTYLVRRLEGLPVLLAATVRTNDPGTDPALLAEIAHDPVTTVIRPGPLTAQAVRDVIRSRLGAEADDAFAAACTETTGGNPLLLVQLLGALAADGVAPAAEQVPVVRQIGPRAVSRTVLLRLARLPAEAHEVARAVAVLGEHARLPAVATLAGLDDDQVAVATAALARADILRPEPPLGFVHPLVREAVYHDLPPGDRELRHARAARLLADQGAPPEQVATHLLHVPGRTDAWVVATLREAGAAAARSGAPDSAVAYLRRALDEPPPPGERAVLLSELGLAEALVDGPAAAAHLDEARALLEDPVARGTAAYVLARTHFFIGPPERMTEIIGEELPRLSPEQEDLRRSLEALEAVAAMAFGVGLDGAHSTAGRDRLAALRTRRADPPRGDGPGTKMLQAVMSWQWACEGGPAEACAELASTALAGGELIRIDNGLLSVSAAATLEMADREEGLTVWDYALADAHRRGSYFLLLTVHLWRGWALLRRGELAEAEASMLESLAEAELWGSHAAVTAYHLTCLAHVLLDRGDVAGAAATLHGHPDPPPASDAFRMFVLARAEVALAENRAAEAVELVDRAIEHTRRFQNPAWWSWRSPRARALDRLGRRDEALADAREEVAAARHWGAPGVVGTALRVLGTIERGDEGLAHLDEAVRLLEASPRRLELARALAAQGTALRQARRPTEAREPLRRALELAEVCGARPLAEQARTELYASGSRPRAAALRGPGALTASERRVATLAAGGHTNRDIAQELFVTPKTVELHLSNAYRKLEIRSRRELAAAMALEEEGAAA